MVANVEVESSSGQLIAQHRIASHSIVSKITSVLSE